MRSRMVAVLLVLVFIFALGCKKGEPVAVVSDGMSREEMQKEMESFKKELLEEIKKIPPARVSDIPIISTTSKSATHDTLPKPKVPKKPNLF